MLITEQTKYVDILAVEKHFKDKSIEELKAAAVKHFGSFYDLTFETFHECADGNYTKVLGDISNPTVLQVYYIKAFEDFVKEFVEQLGKLQIPPTADEKKAASNLLQVNWDEGMLVFVQRFFGLKSFKEAEQITMGEILIAKRAQYNDDLFRRRLNNIQVQKMKIKKR